MHLEEAIAHLRMELRLIKQAIMIFEELARLQSLKPGRPPEWLQNSDESRSKHQQNRDSWR